MKMIKVTEVRVGYYTPDLEDGFYQEEGLTSLEEVVEFDKKYLSNDGNAHTMTEVVDSIDETSYTFEIVDTVR